MENKGKDKEMEKFQDLEINYKIMVKVGKFEFSVPVGFGYKTITWLALCGAQ
jgi:hypothetical protein